ncbi:MAG: agmatinase [Desulfomonile tiedjei]|uniref:Agmatinase n=1 Tax=Desulfomonile tiedjei TaxID=2358 RepID=A0A9D6Z298_9BACT|nr:agmatinase [Desulfomonile tiedjei]
MPNIQFLGSSSTEILPGKPVLLGCPLDLTATFRSGSDLAPEAIRIASDSIETYSPLLDMDLLDVEFIDAGDADVSGSSVGKALDSIEKTAAELLRKGARLVTLGGEHTITLPLIKALERIHPDIVLLHADAHTDLRDQYEGSSLNHATVIKRITEIIGPRRLIQMGIRSGTREEFSWMRENGTLMKWDSSSSRELYRRIDGRPLYFTLDLDVLDPACLHATGNPEPGGWFYQDMERLFELLLETRMVAADVVELNPKLDPSQMGAITASKIVRELLLIVGQNR